MRGLRYLLDVWDPWVAVGLYEPQLLCMFPVDGGLGKAFLR